MNLHQQVKAVGINGQLSLGKAWAGKTVMIDQTDENTCVIKAGQFIPESEKWLWEAEHKAKLDAALAWAEQHTPHETALDSLISKSKTKRV